MIPFLHIGPLSIPTFGLMVALGMIAAAYILQADLNRRHTQLESIKALIEHDQGFLIIGIAGIAGLVGAKVYHVLQDPATWRAELFSRYGFAWFGGFLGGFFALVILAHRAKIPVLQFLDIGAPAACIGYAIGRLGCFLSGDGDYGKPTNWSWPWGLSFPHGTVPTTETCVQWGWPSDCRVYPTPIYEFFAWLAIGAFLWHMGTKSLRGPRAKGEIFCNYLILTGVARFLVEIIRINPRSFLGMTNAQVASVGSLLFGAVLLWRLEKQFRHQKK